MPVWVCGQSGLLRGSKLLENRRLGMSGMQQGRSRWKGYRQRLLQRASQAVNFRLPFVLRLDSTRLPPTVRKRARNPCLRFLMIVLGWYVRFVDMSSVPGSTGSMPS